MSQSTRSLPSPPTDIKQPVEFNSNNENCLAANKPTAAAVISKKEQTNTSNTNKATLIQPLKPSSNKSPTASSSSKISSSPNSTIKSPSNNSNKRSLSDTISSLPPTKYDIIHDPNYCMFKIQLDLKGNSAALCYLPTRFKNIIEFYHIEIPVAYRNQGFGDILLYKAFQWVEKANMMVIPTCPFVIKYLETRFPDKKSGNWSCIIKTAEKEAATTFIK